MSLSQCDVPCLEVDFNHVMTRKQNITNVYNGVEKEESFPLSNYTLASNAGDNVFIVPEHSKKKNLIWRNGKRAYHDNTSPNKPNKAGKTKKQKQK